MKKMRCPKCNSHLVTHSAWDHITYDWFCVDCSHTFDDKDSDDEINKMVSEI